jgi:hypothetical protein
MKLQLHLKERLEKRFVWGCIGKRKWVVGLVGIEGLGKLLDSLLIFPV